MKHLDLFSGIGGFALAVDAIWPDAEHVFCEIDPFCQQVLKKHFPNSPIHADIKTFKANDLGRIDLLTGGFPCQPFSQAGKQRGEEDDRYLWPQMLRVIKESKPTWIIGENVAGIINMALEQACIDLENEGYEVQPIIIPACAVNAPHRRDRVWIVAYNAKWANGEYNEGKAFGQKQELGESSGVGTLANSSGEHGAWSEPERNCEWEPQEATGNGNCTASDSKSCGHRGKPSEECGAKEWELEPCESEGCSIRCESERCDRSCWGRSWVEVATELCGVDDGLPLELDGLKLTKAKHRAERLKALGNAIVPQVALKILRAMKRIDDLPKNNLAFH